MEGSSLIPPAITICHMEKVILPLVKYHQYGAVHISRNYVIPDGVVTGQPILLKFYNITKYCIKHISHIKIVHQNINLIGGFPEGPNM